MHPKNAWKCLQMLAFFAQHTMKKSEEYSPFLIAMEWLELLEW